MADVGEPCVVCTEPLTETSGADCMRCGRPYHLNRRNDIPGKDCGTAWINDAIMSLEFACEVCLSLPEDEEEPEFSLDDVLDLDEAAEYAGWSAEQLQRAADAGQVAHRKTGGGIYLFRRGDLPRGV